MSPTLGTAGVLAECEPEAYSCQVESLQSESLVELLRRDHLHNQDLGTVVELLRHRLEEENIPYAVVGALAVREWGHGRFTEDIDILTTREGLDAIHEKLVGRDLALRGPTLRKSFREPTRRVNVDVIVAGEHAGSAQSPIVFPPPNSDSFVTKEGIRFPTLPLLIELKLASGIWGKRLKDFGDVQELIKANALDESFAGKLRPEVRPRFLEILELSRGEETLE